MALTPQSVQYFRTSWALDGSARKLYVITPICTPWNFEFGLARRFWMGRAAVASAANPRRVRVMDLLEN
jgi:hypothetical protein